mmetsp:Transcript_3604/g.11260  ORF Transcript_3604/g.11260 Transcript_3604/m.11260 type:complete len:361 (+) Transcript_3604:116-1198(+)
MGQRSDITHVWHGPRRRGFVQPLRGTGGPLLTVPPRNVVPQLRCKAGVLPQHALEVVARQAEELGEGLGGRGGGPDAVAGQERQLPEEVARMGAREHPRTAGRLAPLQGKQLADVQGGVVSGIARVVEDNLALGDEVHGIAYVTLAEHELCGHEDARVSRDDRDERHHAVRRALGKDVALLDELLVDAKIDLEAQGGGQVVKHAVRALHLDGCIEVLVVLPHLLAQVGRDPVPLHERIDGVQLGLLSCGALVQGAQQGGDGADDAGVQQYAHRDDHGVVRRLREAGGRHVLPQDAAERPVVGVRPLLHERGLLRRVGGPGAAAVGGGHEVVAAGHKVHHEEEEAEELQRTQEVRVQGGKD